VSLRYAHPGLLVLALLFGCACLAHAQSTTVRVEVRSGSESVPGVTVVVNGVTRTTDAQGVLVVEVAPGRVEITAVKSGFAPLTATVQVAPGQEQQVLIDLTRLATVEEEVVVVASTRTERRIEDQPIRVEVVGQDEIDEKVFMTPGDVSMMLTETNGLRVQVTSPSLGAASVRVQGLRGRYTQVLADGLPLYGQTGSVGVLQIPPMDLGQLEVIKGVASALYGGSALGGVINLVSRRPARDRREREVLVNRTSRGGTDTVVWLSDRGRGRWGYTFLGGGHWQERTDIDRDGWTDLPSYRRAVARPRFTWEDGAGRSLFFTVGAMAEDRQGGSMPGATSPDGTVFPEDLTTTRFDVGLIGRLLTESGKIVSFRSSGYGQWNRHQFGEVNERDVHHTWFGETTITGQRDKHIWVLGAALQRDLYRAKDLPDFDYTYSAPGVFAQDDYSPAKWLIMSASGRVDFHSDFGTFVSPRVSALLKSATGWTLRLSGGTGYVPPTPFTEETEATGLTRLAPLGRLDPERGRSASVDLGWKRGPLEITATLFRSAIHDALTLRETAAPGAGATMEIVNAVGPTRTAGSELIARFHRQEMDLIATHMYVWSTEPDPALGVRREVPLNPRHTAGLDWLLNISTRGRMGIELFYTGRQQLDDSPYRRRSNPYVLLGMVAEWRVGRARLFVNAENLTGVRQTDQERLVRPSRGSDGRWTVDVWGPLEGRIVNGGVRLGF